MSPAGLPLGERVEVDLGWVLAQKETPLESLNLRHPSQGGETESHFLIEAVQGVKYQCSRHNAESEPHFHGMLRRTKENLAHDG